MEEPGEEEAINAVDAEEKASGVVVVQSREEAHTHYEPRGALRVFDEEGHTEGFGVFVEEGYREEGCRETKEVVIESHLFAAL